MGVVWALYGCMGVGCRIAPAKRRTLATEAGNGFVSSKQWSGSLARRVIDCDIHGNGYCGALPPSGGLKTLQLVKCLVETPLQRRLVAPHLFQVRRLRQESRPPDVVQLPL